MNVGFMHPGEMGISLAASVQRGGHVACWASAGRSARTRARAETHGLTDCVSIEALSAECGVLVCVCPPHAAEDVAGQVAAHAFRGVYVDANAISPERTIRIGRMLESGGAEYVDGGIIGGPAWEPGETRIYLSGARATEVAALFSAGPLETACLGAEVGAASAIKMCYAAYTKGTAALLCAILAAAEALGVRQALEAEWRREGGSLAEEAHVRARRVTRKAWRFAGEMTEIAETFRQAGQPDGFHDAAGEVYRRLAHLKDAPELPEVEAVLAALSGQTRWREGE